jgi:large subunit ribosomal protein L29
MILKAIDLREKSEVELREELEKLRRELFESRMKFHSRNLENTSSLRELKKSIARIHSVLNEKKLDESKKEQVA